ncbi:hypothetical protein H6F94_28835 [Leptolyngbya sp. FACHB-261]|nr:hypothetical protein [Leptolyngbya sp. FACHB-261]
MGEQALQHLYAFFCLVPVFGFFPALWTLYRRQGTPEQIAASRVAVTLALSWVLGYALFATGAQASEALKLPLLLTSSLLSSAYFLSSCWLMFRLWRRQPLRLPLVSKAADHLP